MEGRVLTHWAEGGSLEAVVENADSTAPHHLCVELLRGPGETNSGREIISVGRGEFAYNPNDGVGSADRAKIKLGQLALFLSNRSVVLPAQAQVESEVRAHFPVRLPEEGVVAGTQIALGWIGQAGLRVYVYAFKDGGAVEEIPQSDIGIYRTSQPDLVVVILLLRTSKPNFNACLPMTLLIV